jgi:hypothetical protein
LERDGLDGLGKAHAFIGLVGPVFLAVAIFLCIGSINTIRNGRRLRRHYPPIPASARRAMLKLFLLVVLLEVVAIAFVGVVAWRLHRPDLGTDWAAMVVGLHFLPLARAFRSPLLNIIGILTTLWCVLCWTLFRSDALGRFIRREERRLEIKFGEDAPAFEIIEHVQQDPSDDSKARGAALSHVVERCMPVMHPICPQLRKSGTPAFAPSL